jgi:methionyl-tRNA formyltransferase
MKLIFMGTPDFSVRVLESLVAAGHEIVCVYSQPPRAAGRGHNLRASAVQVFAEQLGLLVRTPLNFKASEDRNAFLELNADAAVVVAYGLLLPQVILDAPKFGCFNVHASLLPRWRGAAPIQRAIMAGDATTGVTIMRMEAGLDTGTMITVERFAITSEMTAATLHDELASIGGPLMVVALENPTQPGTPQPDDGVTYAKKIEKAEAHIDFNRAAADVVRHINGLSPFPGAWCMIKNARVKILKATPETGEGKASSFLDDALLVGCATGSVRFVTLQREGKGSMDAATFLRGFSVSPGDEAS